MLVTKVAIGRFYEASAPFRSEAAEEREGQRMFDDYVWLNEPAHWSVQGDTLRIRTERATDFWRTTHYGFDRDSGHFFGLKTKVVSRLR